MTRRTNRRRFLGQSAAIATGFWLGGTSVSRADRSPNEKLNIAFIAAGGRAGDNIRSLKALGENIVAFADVDDKRAGRNFEANPKTPRFRDYRKMLETTKGIDAVVVSTPDHTHGPASMAAMRLGKHIYCEKPLAHSVYEVRLMRDTAEKGKLATQMGNLGAAAAGFRQGVEVIQSGAIGPVHTVHVWTNRPGKSWKQGIDTPTERPPVPETLDWDLWLGSAPVRPYHPAYLPHNWRGWYDFGCGPLGDMGCHTANLPFMALKLGSPTSVQAETSERKRDCFPTWTIITFQFPARGELPPVKLVWYDGGALPPQQLFQGVQRSPGGCVMIGSKGTLFSADDYGVTQQLLPKADFAGFKPPAPSLPRASSQPRLWHYKEWVDACKGAGPKPLCNFDYAAALTEVCLLGIIAVRTGKKITWDAAAMKAVGCPEADGIVKPEFRKGWDI